MLAKLKMKLAAIHKSRDASNVTCPEIPSGPTRQQVLVEMPTEIWLLVLRYATMVPDPIQPSIQAFCMRSPVSHVCEKRFKESLITKYAVVRVCKHWYSLTIPFLYEHISINRVTKLFAALTCLSNQLGDGRTNLGCHTKRLDVILRDEEVQWDPFNRNLELVEKLLETLPNLATLIFRFASKFQPHFMDSGRLCLEAASPQLKYVSVFHETTFNPPVVSGKLWASFLSKHPELRAVSCHLDTKGPDEAGLGRYQLIHLSELVVYNEVGGLFYLDSFDQEDLPNLRQLTFVLPRIRSSDLTYEPNPLIYLYGPQLTKVHLRYEGSWSRDVLPQALDNIKTECPRLEQLWISAYWEDSLNFPSGNLPTVTIFGIQHLAHQFSVKASRPMFEAAINAKGFFPNLTTVRLFDERNVMHLKRKVRKGLKTAVENLALIGVNLEDTEGERVTSC